MIESLVTTSKARAKRTIWRFVKTGRVGRDRFGNFIHETRLETTLPGRRCDWAIGTTYDQLGHIEYR